MCGIFGSFNFDRAPVADTILSDMANSIRHRGPDAGGWHADDLVSLGNRRLSILDLSQASDQPIFSDDRRTIVVQNGEIYNYIELRDELRQLGATFHTQGDTEVLLRAYEVWGPEFVSRLNGMFAIAIYDSAQAQLYLYRDRLGVKPLYIAGSAEEGRIWFGSEIKAILANGQSYTPDLSALAQFFALNYIPQPATAFTGIRHLPPGHMACLSQQNGLKIRQYWDLNRIHVDTDMSEAEAKGELLAQLDDATRIRMRSDAPYGAFLSGGLDSSSVVGMMSLYQTQPLHTFSIGFDDPRFDETKYALMAAKRFGMRHEVKIADHDAACEWAHFIWHCDQPHGDVSFIPTGQVAKLAAKQVKMVLTGDGGDELFAGYEKYQDLFPDGRTDHLENGWEDRFVRQSGLLQGDEPDTLLTGALHEAFHDSDPYKSLSDAVRHADHQDPVNRVLYAETTTLLPGNNLVKPDRMAMAHSLEVRSPFLDYRMAEFAFSVPGALKLRHGETKWIYKKAVEPLLGADLTWRKKQMFTVPIGEWFRQALTGYCRDILLDGRLEARALFSMEKVSQMLTQHVAGEANYTRQLRALISTELWFRLFVDQDADFRPQVSTPTESD
ncbi:MAG: asparagine synthase (glutamine-hydrolyzing) [Pelagimonas sp.]